MPFPTLLRRNRKSEANIRRHSVLVDSSVASTELIPPVVDPSASLESLSARSSDTPQMPLSVGSGRNSKVPSRLTQPNDRIAPPPVREHDKLHPGLARFRYASESQLSTKAKQHAVEALPTRQAPVAPGVAPSIVTTAPLPDTVPETSEIRRSRFALRGRLAKARDNQQTGGSYSGRQDEDVGQAVKREGAQVAPDLSSSGLLAQSSADSTGPPPAYGDDHNSLLALPLTRLSESSRSDGSSAERIAYATTTTTHTVSTTTTFFRLQRRKKPRPSLCPLPAKLPPSESDEVCEGEQVCPTAVRIIVADVNLPPQAPVTGEDDFGPPSAPTPLTSLGSPSAHVVREEDRLLRRQSGKSARSSRSSPSLAPPIRLSSRGRSSTMESVSDEARHPTSLGRVGRSSTSTAGRSSLANFFTLSHRLRPSSDSPFPRRGSPVASSRNTSKPNSFSIPREPSSVVPEREAEETPAKYLVRLQEAVRRGAIAGNLSKSEDNFFQAVLRSYLRSFAFFEDPMDMAIRKLLMEAELPKETQQIDRFLQKFADRYHECNPGIFSSPDQAYFTAFSLLILHTDVFNKNNKRKMQKQDYVRNTRGEGVPEEVLECFYDNICYTPFIHLEDDSDVTRERVGSRKIRKSIFPRGSSDTLKKGPKLPVDPYTLIIDHKLDYLRPNLKDVMNSEDPYGYLGTAKSLDIRTLQKTFFRSGILQIVSARSRPDAFTSPVTISNPEDAHPGVVEIKVTKVGILQRKDPKKKKARSPWQEWGAILTGSKLYFFRNTSWTRSLLQQYESHQKHGQAGSPVIFKPPLDEFEADENMQTNDAVALIDSSYKKHKHAFLFVRHGGFEETLLAENENEMNDWIAKLNYAASFRTSGVRMRAMSGNAADVQRSKSIRNLDPSSSNATASRSNLDTQAGSNADSQLTQQILSARRQIMIQRIREANEKLSTATTQLENQLRTSRHLQILAPIQSKTREQVVLAAGRMAARLKWIRMEICRLKCYREILILDLKDEGVIGDIEALVQSSTGEFALGASVFDGQRAATKGSQNSKSAVTVSPSHSSRSPRLISRPQSKDKESGTEAMPKTFIEPSRQFSHHTRRASLEAANLATSPHSSTNEHSIVDASGLSRVGSLNDRPSILDPLGLVQSSPSGIARLATRESSVDEAEAEVLKEAGLLHLQESPRAGSRRLDLNRQTDDQQSISEEEGHEKDKSRARRSLHRTLRDGSHVPAQYRNRKGRDSASSTAITEDGSLNTEKEGLMRGTGSFTLHGKKASVVTFGSEWQNMSPEERLKSRKQAHTEGSLKSQTSPTMSSEDPGLPGPSSHVDTGPTGSARSSALIGELPPGLLNHTNSKEFQRSGALNDPFGVAQAAVFSTPRMRRSCETTGKRTSAGVTSDEEYQSAAEDVNTRDSIDGEMAKESHHSPS
ncbi:MAG: hypothetical protein M1816_003605 [Peltula sp. TS41687]|nr:MAG: hypothetical protein M1816_003605 [Peltula sp. TS41687]